MCAIGSAGLAGGWWLLTSAGVRGTSAAAFVACLGYLVSLVYGMRLSRRLVRRSRQLAHEGAMVAMAERLAEFGHWCAFPDGRHEWSEGLLRLTGFPAGCLPDQQTRLELLPDRGAGFYRALGENAKNRGRYSFEFEFDRVDGARRILRVVAQNVFDRHGRLLQRIGVALDVTEDRRRLALLDQQRGEAVRQVEEAIALAETDALTGLANRRRAMAEVDRAILRSTRTGEPLSLILFDIDHFKKVNDSFGHPAGDAVLVRLAEIARQVSRESDLLARIGGEEFLWLLPDCPPGEAFIAAERMRSAIARESACSGVPAVTASIGIALWRRGDAGLKLFALADVALYEAKNSGRNTVRKAA